MNGAPLLILVFAAGAGATWAAGVVLSRATDSLDVRLNLGDELGGILLLAVAGTLPEVAITVSAAAQGNLGLAAGNLIGGIAVQTMVLVLCDLMVEGSRPLTFLVGALTPVLEGMLVVLVVAAVLMGALLPPSTEIGTISPASIVIVLIWVAGVYVINRVRKDPRWRVSMPGSRPGRRHRRDGTTNGHIRSRPCRRRASSPSSPPPPLSRSLPAWPWRSAGAHSRTLRASTA